MSTPSPTALFVRLRRRLSACLFNRRRWRLARRYLRGRGLELGALHSPFRLPAAAVARYVDRLPMDQLREHYPELAHHSFAPVDILDDAETLATIPTGSQDFVVASHVLEHCEDPILALRSWLRVLKPGGVVLLAVPDMRFTFDRKRAPTSLSHVLLDHSHGPSTSRREHYVEWLTLVDPAPAEAVPERASTLMSARYSIHFHAWDAAGLAELLQYAVASNPEPARLVAFLRNRAENLAVIDRPPRGTAPLPRRQAPGNMEGGPNGRGPVRGL